jgi:NAD(P)H-flavin reductase/Na+-translocating ferredoxin:NAD+ oxidoreductase RnfD subunit
MYRLVLIVLGVIWLAAMVYGAFGIVAFSPLAQLASLAVALIFSYASNRLFAWIWRVKPHSESSLITGALLFFLFLPLLTAQALLAVAIAVVAANLSKYLLAWHGRHIFNPVALGAVVVLFTRVSGATWWVATPALLPFIVIGGALVLYRANAWDMAIPVFLIAVAGTIVKLSASGMPIGPSIWSAVGSYPYLFFAAFMVSEPLTSPPRRWQRILVSSLIGVIVLIPVQVAVFEMAPEIALVLGNIAAFFFGPRRRVRLTLLSRTDLAGGIVDLVFRPESRLRFRPGQYVELSLPHRSQDGRGARRVFSVASAPDSDTLRIVTRLADPGDKHSTFKRALLALKPGDAVAGSAIGGDFVVSNPSAPALWITGGIGITPFMSFADAAASAGPGGSGDAGASGRSIGDTTMIWVVRPGDELGWIPQFSAAGVRVLVVGPTEFNDPGRLPDGWTYVGSRLNDLSLANHVPDVSRRAVYAAGSPRIVAIARQAARKNGVRRIRTDRFLGY